MCNCFFIFYAVILILFLWPAGSFLETVINNCFFCHHCYIVSKMDTTTLHILQKALKFPHFQSFFMFLHNLMFYCYWLFLSLAAWTIPIFNRTWTCSYGHVLLCDSFRAYKRLKILEFYVNFAKNCLRKRRKFQEKSRLGRPLQTLILSSPY